MKSVSEYKRHKFIESTYCKLSAYSLMNKKEKSPSKNRLLEIKFEKASDFDKVHLEGTLDKYHPGFSSMYVPRECKVKPLYFEYYNSSIQYLKVPLRRILIKDIQSVSRVSIGTADKKKSKYQFEITMKEDWDPKKNYFEETNTKLETQRIPTIRSHSAARLKASHNHLMPKPLLLNKYKETLEAPVIKRDCKKIVEGVWTVGGISFSSKDEARAYREYIQRNELRLITIKCEERIEVKNPKKWINSLSGNHTWNNRELEWYLSEQRMLFSTRSKEECKRWILILNWLMQCK